MTNSTNHVQVKTTNSNTSQRRTNSAIIHLRANRTYNMIRSRIANLSRQHPQLEPNTKLELQYYYIRTSRVARTTHSQPSNNNVDLTTGQFSPRPRKLKRRDNNAALDTRETSIVTKPKNLSQDRAGTPDHSSTMQLNDHRCVLRCVV